MTQPQPDLPPQAVMMQMVNGKLVSRCVSIVADLGVADLLEDGPRDAAGLASETGSDEDALYRVLRTLSGLGVFRELDGRRFENTPLSDALRSDAPGSVRHYARWLGTDLHWRVTADMDHSVRTGRPAILKDRPDARVFDILAEHPEEQSTFNEAMSGLSLADGAAIVEAYDFGVFDRIVDVGGGHGILARMIAESAPDAEVTVLEQAHVVESAAAAPGGGSGGDDGSVRFVAGDFLEGVSGPADLCVLKHIIHDWDDADARTILTNCREALADGGRVLVCEMVVTDGPESIPARILDIEMLIGPGGRERTRDEFARLFESAGLGLERVVETRTPIRLLEGTPR